jgi:hypothetical protein
MPRRRNFGTRRFVVYYCSAVNVCPQTRVIPP